MTRLEHIQSIKEKMELLTIGLRGTRTFDPDLEKALRELDIASQELWLTYQASANV